MSGCLQRFSLAAAVVVLFALGAAPAARAQQPPDAHDAEAAEVLFRDGKRLFDGQQFAEACPKLAESQRLDPAGGTLLLLALCYENEGKTATAWSTFNEAAGVARRDKRDDREARSQEHLVALEQVLSKLTVRVAPALAAIEALEVRRNGKVIPRSIWGSALPVDPGLQRIEAAAPGKKPWVREITIGARADRQVLEVVGLEELPAAPGSARPLASAPPAISSPAVAPPAREADSGPSSLRLSSYIVGAVGLVALGGGAYFGLRASNLWNDSKSTCPDSACNNQTAVTQSHDAKVAATWATAGFGLGAAGLVGGVVLFALSGRPTESTSSFRVLPVVGAQASGLVARGAW
jgi:hypothetical protein